VDLKVEEKEVVASVLKDCTPLKNFDNLDVWWLEFKKRYSYRKKEMNKKLKLLEDLEKEVAEN
jgi:hypothetical protein